MPLRALQNPRPGCERSERRRGTAAARPDGPRAAGFVVTVELLLIFAILAIGAVAAVVGLRYALIRFRERVEARQVTVRDATAPTPLALGRAVSYDLCEAPQIQCVDRGFDSGNSGPLATPGASAGLRALVGVRPDRFVTRNQIYFTGAGCTGDAYIAPPPVPGSPNFPPELPVGYFNCGLQVDASGERVCYGVGPPTGWGASPACDDAADLPCATGGRLYRSLGSTTSMPPITSRWVSLSPDCAELGGAASAVSTGELVANNSFEVPVLADGGSVGAVGAPWVVAGPRGTFNPLATGPGPPDPPFDGPHFSPGAPPSGLPTQNVPDGMNTFFSNGGSATQSIAGVPVGASCTLSAWIGRRADFVTPPFIDPNPFAVTLSNATPVVEAGLAGAITAASPEWTLVSTTFTAAGPGPYSLSVSATGVQVNFDLVSLACVSGAAVIDVCDDAFDSSSLALLPAVEVTDMSGANLLSPFAPLFNVTAPVEPVFGTTPPTPEGVPPAPPPSRQIAPLPEGG